MSNDENNTVTNVENNAINQTNTTIDAYGNYVSGDSAQKNEGEKKGPDKKIISLIGGVVIALAVIVMLLNSLGGGGAKGVAEKYAKAYKNLDAKAIVDLLPEDVIKTAKEQDADLEASLKEEFDELKELGIEIISVSVDGDGEKLSKETIDDNSFTLGMYGIDNKDVTEAIVYTIKLTAKNSDGDTKDNDVKVTVINYKDSWKLLPFDIS